MVVFIALVLGLVVGIHGRAANNRIVGGGPAFIEDYPSLVQMERYSILLGTWDHNCGGNIINNLYILSAAHCTSGPLFRPEWRRLRAGSTYRNTGGVIFNVDTVINHPTYGSRGLDGDICLLRLQSFIQYTPVIQPGVIIANDVDLPDGTPVVQAGWGNEVMQGSGSPILQNVTVYTINHDLCRERYEPEPTPEVTENMICVGILDEGGRGPCQGDSGGPLYYGNIIVGLVSWTHSAGCAHPFFPTLNVRVSSYTNWIVENAV